jgi:hypothetical protein
MKKAIVIFLIALVAVWLATSYFVTRPHSAVAEPTIEQAPYVVQAFSSYIYAVKVSGTSPNIKVTGYYEKRGGKWVYFKGVLSYNKNVGTITVIRR